MTPYIGRPPTESVGVFPPVQRPLPATRRLCVFFLSPVCVSSSVSCLRVARSPKNKKTNKREDEESEQQPQEAQWEFLASLHLRSCFRSLFGVDDVCLMMTSTDQ